MPYYYCFIRGENFPGVLLDADGPVGFYTTRWVEAANPDEAEIAAVEALKRDPSFALPEGHPRPKDARVFVEEIPEIEGPPKSQGKGASWFVEGDEDSAPSD